MASKLNQIPKVAKIPDTKSDFSLTQDKVIIAYCASGIRVRTAVSALEGANYEVLNGVSVSNMKSLIGQLE